jgi:RNase adaptor protein for sRNA GlmZ degradation
MKEKKEKISFYLFNKLFPSILEYFIDGVYLAKIDKRKVSIMIQIRNQYVSLFISIHL